MKAVFYNKYGTANVLEIGDLEKPIINDDEILVQSHASSVNPVDWKIRNGSLKILTGKKFPKGLGGDIAGEVSELGGKVTGFEIGDEVYGKLSGLKSNAYAEFVVAKPGDLFRKPVNLNFIQAATVPLAALTAYQALVTQGRLIQGSKVLINGCSGGVGHFGVQIAKALGADVTGVCSTKNIVLAKKLGADKIIDYTKENVIDNKEKYDIFFDAVANQSYRKIKSILNKNGIYVTTLPAVGVILNIITGLFSSKKAKIINVKSNSRDLQMITEMIESDKIEPIIDKIYPLENVSDAHRYSETGRVIGKLALSIK
ncbi:MAG: zinc-binding dehydrogenase [Planctomycetia bacterium]|nr:zinc-binding dehydrogenase [Planctomycetia bacterium]